MSPYSSSWSLRATPRRVFFVCLGIMYFSWVKFLFDEYTVYIFDYLFRIIVVVLVFAAGVSLPRPKRVVRSIVFSMLAICLMVTVFEILSSTEFYYTQFVDLFPLINNKELHIVDLSLGLILVAISEELVFRDLFSRAYLTMARSEVGLSLASSLAFGLLHVPQGLAPALIATVAGLVLMALFRVTSSLWPGIVVHFAIDFIVFSELRCMIGIGMCP